jgi:hypothetical protein
MDRKVLLVVLLACACAFAWHGGDRGNVREGFHGEFRGSNGYYSGYYHPFWFPGAFVPYLPYYTIVVVGDDSYYYCDGTYFLSSPGGYVIVDDPMVSPPVTVQPEPTPASKPAPVEKAQAPAQQKTSDTISINVPNSKGGYIAVKLIKHKDGYLGPQGEYYAGHPTVAELKALYGD